MISNMLVKDNFTIIFESDTDITGMHQAINIEFKASLKCWELNKFDGKISPEMYNNIKEDVLYKQKLLQGFSQKNVFEDEYWWQKTKLRFSAYNNKPKYGSWQLSSTIWKKLLINDMI